MKTERVEGMGSIRGGEYESILVEGMGKLKGDATAKTVKVDGAFKSKGVITAEEFIVGGFARVYREVRVKRLRIDGTLKLRRANVNATTVDCDGLLTSTREISADEINIKGICSVKKMTGDQINISSEATADNQLVKRLKWPAILYFGRKLALDRCFIDTVECTRLYAYGLDAKLVRAGSATLEDCAIDRLYCDSKPKVSKNCRINHIYYGTNKNGSEQKEDIPMGNVSVKKILELYKHNTIDAEEAELMLEAAVTAVGGTSGENSDAAGSYAGLPWENDDKLRFVAFLGRRLLKKEEAAEHKLTVDYDGNAKNVECHGSLSCGDITGNVSAGQSIQCGDIGGNVSCGGNISCSDIGGNVACAGAVGRGAGR